MEVTFLSLDVSVQVLYEQVDAGFVGINLPKARLLREKDVLNSIGALFGRSRSELI